MFSLFHKLVYVKYLNLIIFSFNSDIKPGHMPGAINVPFLLMLNPETKTLKTPAEMKEVFKQKGIDVDKPLTSTCGSGELTSCYHCQQTLQ